MIYSKDALFLAIDYDGGDVSLKFVKAEHGLLKFVRDGAYETKISVQNLYLSLDYMHK